MQKFKRKKILKGMLVGIGLMSLTLFVFSSVVLWLFLTGGPATKTKDIDRYQEIFGWNTMSGMMVFPEEVPQGAVETDFDYRYRDMLFSRSYQIYFQCTYEPEAYQQEIARLENVRKVYGGTEKKLLRDEENKYRYPAYIAIDNHHHCYEYALVTGKNQITYIATAYIDEEEVVFNKDYLPIDFMTEAGRAWDSGYCMYITLATSEFIDYDTTRNKTVEVTNGHSEQILDSYFVVRTKLDEANREIITECCFDYFESLEDETVDTTSYPDINGMEYKDLKLNADRTEAIVVYYDGSVEKEFVVKLPLETEE